MAVRLDRILWQRASKLIRVFKKIIADGLLKKNSE
jgi:hypothetical protein